MVFRTWTHERAPLNSQWPVLKNGGAHFHHCWFVDSMYRDDYKFSEMIGQKPLIAILYLNLIG